MVSQKPNSTLSSDLTFERCIPWHTYFKRTGLFSRSLLMYLFWHTVSQKLYSTWVASWLSKNVDRNFCFLRERIFWLSRILWHFFHRIFPHFLQRILLQDFDHLPTISSGWHRLFWMWTVKSTIDLYKKLNGQLTFENVYLLIVWRQNAATLIFAALGILKILKIQLYSDCL